MAVPSAHNFQLSLQTIVTLTVEKDPVSKGRHRTVPKNCILMFGQQGPPTLVAKRLNINCRLSTRKEAFNSNCYKLVLNVWQQNYFFFSELSLCFYCQPQKTKGECDLSASPPLHISTSLPEPKRNALFIPAFSAPFFLTRHAAAS